MTLSGNKTNNEKYFRFCNVFLSVFLKKKREKKASFKSQR